MDDDLRVSLRRRSSPTGREESRSAYLKSESDARENTRIQNVYSGKASRVLRVLLRKPRTWNLTTLGNELTSETRANPFVSAESDVRRGTFEISLGSISKAPEHAGTGTLDKAKKISDCHSGTDTSSEPVGGKI